MAREPRSGGEGENRGRGRGRDRDQNRGQPDRDGGDELQDKLVTIVRLISRGTIEEKVLRTLETKQALFNGVFEGDADEIPFGAVNTSGFLDTMRELVEAGEKSEGLGEGERGKE